MSQMIQRKRIALLSVYDKTGLVPFAEKLLALNFKLIASGGTCRELQESGLTVTDVAEFTGLPPILGHRVVTLGPQIHAGLLAQEKDLPELERFGFPWIDLVYCNLYPLEAEIASPDATLESVIEKTDIGGPTMLRSAAKGRRLVIVDPADCDKVLYHLNRGTENEPWLMSYLVAKAEATVARYCLASARYHSQGEYDGFVGEQVCRIPYGENRQDGPATLYRLPSSATDPLALSNLKHAAGGEPGYINWTDFDRALTTLTRLSATCALNNRALKIAVGVKHGNPCGCAIGPDSLDVLKYMLDGDSEAIFGGIVVTNFAIGEPEAEILRTWNTGTGPRRILDGIVAPNITTDAVEILCRKNGACKMYENPALDATNLARLGSASIPSGKMFRFVRGGFLIQNQPSFLLNLQDERLKKIGLVGDEGLELALIVAQCVAWTSNSNNISLARYDSASQTAYLIANGNNQTKRIGALKLALFKATDMQHEVAGSVMASDSFCPFVDVPRVAGDAQIAVGFIPEKGVRVSEVFAEFEKQGITVYSLPDDDCRGFSNH